MAHSLTVFIDLSFSGQAKKMGAFGRKKDYTPVYWDQYFDKMHDIVCGENVSFIVYQR